MCSFKIGMMTDATKLYGLIPLLMALTFIQGHSCMRKQKLRYFLANFSIDLDEM